MASFLGHKGFCGSFLSSLRLLACVWVFAGLHAQRPCAFISDSCVLPPANAKVPVDMLDARIKSNYHIQLIRQGPKQFIRIIVTDNLGFGKTGPVLLKSGGKQMYYKSATLSVIDSARACFMLELYPNYVITLKDEGLTSLVFNNTVEYSIPRQDTETIKELAKCFYSLTNHN